MVHDLFTSILLMGALSSGSALPFWSTAGQYGIMPESSGGVVLLQSGCDAYSPVGKAGTFDWKWGLGAACNFSQAGTVALLDEAYASLRFKEKVTVDLGMRRREQDFLAPGSLGSMSVTGGSVIWSANARTMPGVSISVGDLNLFRGRVVLSGRWADYMTMDKRWMDGAMVHNMAGRVRWNINRRLAFIAALDHCAMWGGTPWEETPESMPMAVNLSNYARVALCLPAGNSGTDSDRENVIGDHRGDEILRLELNLDRAHIALQHDIPYDDGSGMGFANFPDGVNTVHLHLDRNKPIVSDVLLEHQYTKWQSGTFHMKYFWPSTPPPPESRRRRSVNGGDNYFNNGGFRSGWTYYGRTIGNPLFFPCPVDENGLTPGVRNNRLRAVHLSVAGYLFHSSPYRLVITNSWNCGTYEEPYRGEPLWNHDWGTVKDEPLYQLSAAFTGECPVTISRNPGAHSALSVFYGIFADWGEVLRKQAGICLGLRWRLG